MMTAPPPESISSLQFSGLELWKLCRNKESSKKLFIGMADSFMEGPLQYKRYVGGGGSFGVQDFKQSWEMEEI